MNIQRASTGSRSIANAATLAARAVTAPPQNLEKGNRGAAVKQLQEALIQTKHLPAGAADGVYGTQTEAAVKALQRQWKLQVDGEYGPNTRAALQKALRGEQPPGTPPPPSGEVKKPAVVQAPSPNHG